MNNKLYGAILGDLAGQPYEFNYKGDYSEFNLFDERSVITDDTLMTLATAYSLLNNGVTFESAYKYFGNLYSGDHYGASFKVWLQTPIGDVNNSWGNGCLMRCSPIMYMKEDEKKWKSEIRRDKLIESCLCSHSHPVSISACLDLLERYQMFDILGKYVPNEEQYNPTNLEPFEKFEVRADKTLKFIYKASTNRRDSTAQIIERVVKCGGDTDTNASIIGELFNFGKNDLSQEHVEYVESKLDGFLLDVLHQFNERFK